MSQHPDQPSVQRWGIHHFPREIIAMADCSLCDSSCVQLEFLNLVWVSRDRRVSVLPLLCSLTELALLLCAQSQIVPKTIQPSVYNNSVHCIKFKKINYKILTPKLSMALYIFIQLFSQGDGKIVKPHNFQSYILLTEDPPLYQMQQFCSVG